jgi:hypothetical protein
MSSMANLGPLHVPSRIISRERGEERGTTASLSGSDRVAEVVGGGPGAVGDRQRARDQTLLLGATSE